MAHQLTEAEWDDLLDLITASPAERINQALKRIVTAQRPINDPKHHLLPTAQPLTVDRWLIHLASISSGAAFDRALLHELRRLSVH